MDERNRRDPLPENLERGSCDAAKFELRQNPGGQVSSLGVKGVTEGRPHHFFDIIRAINRQRTAEFSGEQPHIIQAEQVVRVVMRVKHGVGDGYFFAQELHPEFGRGVDEQIPGGEFQQDRTARPVVARIGRCANRTLAPDHRHPDGGAGPQKKKRPHRVHVPSISPRAGLADPRARK